MREYKLSSLSHLLGGSLARHGIGDRVLSAQIVASANQLLTELLHSDQRGEVQAVSYKASELLLACKTPTARYAAEGLIKIIARKLEEKYPDQTFRKVICVFRNGKANDDEWYNSASL